MNKHPKFEHLAIHKFKPGKSGNKNGRPKSYVTVLKELGYTKPVIATLTAEIMFMNMDDVEDIISYNNYGQHPAIKVAIARAFDKAAGTGEYKYIADYMNILFGKHIPYIPDADKNDTMNMDKDNISPPKEDNAANP